MRIIANNKLINRNRKIGKYATIASLLVLVGGLIISFNPSADSTLVMLSFGALLVGFLLSQVGIYFGNKFGRSPRPDELISAGLKGLDDRYALYHFLTPVAHLLVGPAGIWIVNPYNQRGKIFYNAQKKKWQQQGGSFIMKIFGQEGMGRPEQENYGLYQDMQKFIQKEVNIPGLPEPQVLMVFVDPKVSVTAGDSPTPAFTLDKMKDFIRKQAKEPGFSYSAVEEFQVKLPQESIEL